MPKFKVIWTIALEKTVEAKNVEEAQTVIENIDCQHKGNYVEDSFEIDSIKELQNV